MDILLESESSFWTLRRKLAALVAAVTVVLGIVWAVFWNDPAQWRTVEFLPVQHQAVANGIFISSQQHTVVAEQAGIVSLVGKLPGQVVRQGDMIITLKNPSLMSELAEVDIEYAQSELQFKSVELDIEVEQDEALQKVEEAKMKLKIAEADLKAHYELFSKKVISKLAFEKLQIQTEIERMSLASTIKSLQRKKEQNLRKKELAQSALSFVELKRRQLVQKRQELLIQAPLDGIVKRTYPKLGQSIAAGDAVAQVGPLQADTVQLRFAQRELDRLHIALKLEVNFNSQTIDAQISRIEPDLRDGFVVVEATAALPDSARIDMPVVATARFQSDLNQAQIAYQGSFFDFGSTVTVKRVRQGKKETLQLHDYQKLPGVVLLGPEWQPGDLIGF